MIIIEPTARLEWVTPAPLDIIERAGRTCYQSEPKGDCATFVERLIKRGHESVLEHAAAGFRIVCDRGVSHELVRHRVASFSQESTRYCAYRDEISVIEPPGLTPPQRHAWELGCLEAEKAYLSMLEHGARAELARAVLPTCLATEIVVTANFREWRHMMRLRLSKAAHPQIRQVLEQVRQWFEADIPVIVADI